MPRAEAAEEIASRPATSILAQIIGVGVPAGFMTVTSIHQKNLVGWLQISAITSSDNSRGASDWWTTPD